MKTENEALHLSGYQARDKDVIDYNMYELDGTGLHFRGPPPLTLKSGEYFACIGAAQTFGCFCKEPYPDLLARRLGLPALNLGYGGAGPEFFMKQSTLHEYINRGKFLVIQVMSGRSQSNSLFDCEGLEYLKRRSDGTSMGADAAYKDLLSGPDVIRKIPAGKLSRILAKLIAMPRVKRVVAETRVAWVNSHQALLSRINVPTILFWFSKRPVAYSEKYRNVGSLFGEFPQMVNIEMVSRVRGMCEHYVECVSDRGSPQLLRSRFTGRPVTVDPSHDRPDLGRGEPWTHNFYYPSPEMHEDGANALINVCRAIAD